MFQRVVWLVLDIQGERRLQVVVQRRLVGKRGLLPVEGGAGQHGQVVGAHPHQVVDRQQQWVADGLGVAGQQLVVGFFHQLINGAIALGMRWPRSDCQA